VSLLPCNVITDYCRFAAGGVATPADAALMMQLGCDGGEFTSSRSRWYKADKPISLCRIRYLYVLSAVTYYIAILILRSPLR
jgi:pyridoxal biosynthesis lyase PdxS